MAETDPAGSSHHVVIDVDEAEAEDDEAAAANMSSCAVCMEPMEWVAVTPCGHREVCVRCAARIRFFHSDRRCCICRSHCATVVVTRADRARATTQREPGGGGFPFLWPPAPAAFGGPQGQVLGVDYWYHRGMGAYFDDVSQYQETSKVCTAAASLSSEGSGAGAAGVNQQPAAASVTNNVVFVNVVSSAPAARQADAAAPLELEGPLSRKVCVSNLYSSIHIHYLLFI
jgi:hypothetical protein